VGRRKGTKRREHYSPRDPAVKRSRQNVQKTQEKFYGVSPVRSSVRVEATEKCSVCPWTGVWDNAVCPECGAPQEVRRG
jgi:hypothetical protein